MENHLKRRRCDDDGYDSKIEDITSYGMFRYVEKDVRDYADVFKTEQRRAYDGIIASNRDSMLNKIREDNIDDSLPSTFPCTKPVSYTWPVEPSSMYVFGGEQGYASQPTTVKLPLVACKYFSALPYTATTIQHANLSIIYDNIAIPPSSTWTPISRNMHIKDEVDLKFVPYFHDDDDEDVVSEFFDDKGNRTGTHTLSLTVHYILTFASYGRGKEKRESNHLYRLCVT